MKRLLPLLLVLALLLCACKKTETVGQENTEDAPLGTGPVVALLGSHELTLQDFYYYYVDAAQNAAKEENGVAIADYVETALNNAARDYALAEAAQSAGFQLDADDQAILQNLETYLNPLSFANTDSDESFGQMMLHDTYGKYATVESYGKYLERSLIADSYYEYYGENLTFTDVELYGAEGDHTGDDNAKKMVSVRHLLVKVADTYTEQDWAEALAEAEKIQKAYLAGDKTEESFVKLVQQYSDDFTTFESGGLYTNIHEGSSYVPEFLNWCMDDVRMPGDIEIVKSDYGYNVMYFVEHQTQSYREYMLTENLRGEKCSQWLQELLAQYPITKKDMSSIDTNQG